MGRGSGVLRPRDAGLHRGRGYLVTAGQLADIAAQEMYRLPVDGDPLELVVRSPLPGGRHTVGPGRYETLVDVGAHDGLPLLTFTSPHGVQHVPHTPPNDTYLSMLRTGLRESRDWDEHRITAYLDSRRGVSASRVRSACRRGSDPSPGPAPVTSGG